MIYLIRHAKVLHDWPKYTSSTEFKDNINEYDQAPVEQISASRIQNITTRIPAEFELFTSQLSRTKATKEQLFNARIAVELHQLNEVILNPYKYSLKKIATWRWFLFGRILWAFNSKERLLLSQKFEQIVDLISKPEHAVVVGHRFSFICLLFFLKRRGYQFSMDSKLINNLDMIICRPSK